MKLLLDIGNTRLRAAWGTPSALREVANVIHADRSMADVLATLKLEQRPAELWVASVAAIQVSDALSTWARSKLGLMPRFVASTRECCGVKNSYADPARLGVDRWLAVIAAHHRGPGAACVVDAGTALTLDVVDASGLHRGGLIAPGVGCQRRSLLGTTERVRPQGEIHGLNWLGISTEEAVAFGTLHSVLGLIERVSTAAAQQHHVKRWLLTGGEAAWLAPHLPGQWQHAPLLVLEGLARVAAGSG